MAEIIEIDLRAKATEIESKLKQVTSRIEELRRLSANVVVGSTEATVFDKLLNNARANARELKKELRQVSFDQKLIDDARKLDDEIDGASQSAIDLKQVLSSAIGFSAANIVSAGAREIVGAVSDAVDSAREFQKTIAEINSILPRSSKLTADVVSNLEDLAKQYGSNATAQARAYYQAVSAGAEDASQATAILAASNAASLATQADLSSVARVLTSTLNAYAGTGLDAATATDILVKSVDDGAVEFQELTNQLARVTPTAAALKVPLDEVVGSIAFLTRVGFTTEQATTSMAAALASIIKPSKEAQVAFNRLGGEFEGVRLNADAVAKSGGLIQFIQKLNKEAKGSTDILSQIFGDERSTKAILAITNNISEYQQVLKNVADSSGATARANEELTETFDFQLKKLGARFSDISTSAGSKLIPALTAAAKLTRAILGDVSEEEVTKEKVDLLTQRIKNLNEELAKPRTGFFFPSDGILLAEINRLTAERAKLTGEAANADVIASQKSSQAIKELSSIVNAFNTQASGVVTPLLPGAETSRIDAVKETNAVLTEEERKFQGEIAAIKQEAALSQQALDLELQNQKLIAQGENFLSQQDIEFKQASLRAEAAYQAEIAKNNAVLAGNELALANELAFQKKKKSIDEADTRRSIANAKAKIALDQQRAQASVDIASAAVNLGAAIAKEGDKTIFLASKAAGIAQAIVGTQTGMAKARAIDPTGALSTKIGIAGALNVATIAATAIKGFADGGIVGGAFNGATAGGDNRMATVRDGEMVLNAQQQKSLFDMINNGGSGGGDIVIQINEREIARAVRNQKQLGFAV